MLRLQTKYTMAVWTAAVGPILIGSAVDGPGKFRLGLVLGCWFGSMLFVPVFHWALRRAEPR